MTPPSSIWTKPLFEGKKPEESKSEYSIVFELYKGGINLGGQVLNDHLGIVLRVKTEDPNWIENNTSKRGLHFSNGVYEPSHSILIQANPVEFYKKISSGKYSDEHKQLETLVETYFDSIQNTAVIVRTKSHLHDDLPYFIEAPEGYEFPRGKPTNESVAAIFQNYTYAVLLECSTNKKGKESKKLLYFEIKSSNELTLNRIAELESSHNSTLAQLTKKSEDELRLRDSLIADVKSEYEKITRKLGATEQKNKELSEEINTLELNSIELNKTIEKKDEKIGEQEARINILEDLEKRLESFVPDTKPRKIGSEESGLFIVPPAADPFTIYTNQQAVHLFGEQTSKDEKHVEEKPEEVPETVEETPSEEEPSEPGFEVGRGFSVEQE